MIIVYYSEHCAYPKGDQTISNDLNENVLNNNKLKVESLEFKRRIFQSVTASDDSLEAKKLWLIISMKRG